MPRGGGVDDPPPPLPEWRRLVAEGIGTFLLTFVALSGDAVEKTLGVHVGDAAKVAAPGLLVMTMIYTIGDVSGAHINPAVTLAFAARGDFEWRRVPAYLIVQFAGAALAAIAIAGMLHPSRAAFHTAAGAGTGAAFWMEVVLSFVLVFVILGTGQEARIVGPNAALAVGGSIVLDGFVGLHVSGASMNPARSLGPLVAGGGSATWWLYVAGPLLGAAAACVATHLVHGPPNDGEKKQGRGSA